MTDLESFFRTISSIAVITGTILVVLQLRVNAKQARSRNAFDLISKVIDPSFPVRQHLLYEVAEKHAGGNWSGFHRSLEDFEVRNFANIYEQLGLLARKGVIDLRDGLDALWAQPMADWDTFEPIRRHIMEEAAKAFPALAINQPGLESIYWPNFRWLAEESRKWTLKRASTGSALRSLDRERYLMARRLHRLEVLTMIKWRARQAGLPQTTCCHTVRATGITTYLQNGDKIEHAQQIANHESLRTTKLYDRTSDAIRLDEIERILI